MASGWRFSVTVPSWTQTTLEADEVVVFYRVEVKVIPPIANGQPRIRSVLRRYNHFVKLHTKLCTELGQKKMAGKDPPAKRALLNINRRPELIERRRLELQQWLWRLVSDSAVAGGKALNEFLELRDAARLVQRSHAPVPSVAASESAIDGSYGMSEASSPRGDAGSEISGFTTASQATDRGGLAAAEAAALGRGALPSADFSVESPCVQPGSRQQSQALSLGTEPLESVEENSMRLGLRVEQRGNLRRLVKDLQRMLGTASSDFQDAVEALHGERETKRQLADRVVELEARLGEDVTEREAELQRLLDQVDEIDWLTGTPAFWQERAASSQLREASSAAATQNEALAAENEKLQAELAEARLQGENTISGAEHEALLRQATEEHGNELAKLRSECEAATDRSDAAEAEAKGARAELDAVRRDAQAATESLEAAKSKSRADMKLLAKEVKTLRKQLSEAQQRADAAESASGEARERGEKLAQAEDLRAQLMLRVEAAEGAAASAAEAHAQEAADFRAKLEETQCAVDAATVTHSREAADLRAQLTERQHAFEAAAEAHARGLSESQTQLEEARRAADAHSREATDLRAQLLEARSAANAARAAAAAREQELRIDAQTRRDADTREAASAQERETAAADERLMVAEARVAEAELNVAALFAQQTELMESSARSASLLEAAVRRADAAESRATAVAADFVESQRSAASREATLMAKLERLKLTAADLEARLRTAQQEVEVAATTSVADAAPAAAPPSSKIEANSNGTHASDHQAQPELDAKAASLERNRQTPSEPGLRNNELPGTAAAHSGGRSELSDSIDPFAQSGSENLFSGLSLTSTDLDAAGDISGFMPVLQSSPTEGQSPREAEEPMLSSRKSSGALSWNSETSGDPAGADLLGIEADHRMGLSSHAPAEQPVGGRPRELSALDLISSSPAPTGAVLASTGLPNEARRGEGGKGSGAGPQPAASKPVPRSSGSGRQPAQQASPSPPRYMGSLMNRIGLSGQSPTAAATAASPQGGTSPSPTAGSLQSFLGGRDKLESLARGYFKRSSGRQEQ